MNRFPALATLLVACLAVSQSARASDRQVVVASQGIAHQVLFDIDARGADAVAVGASGTVLLGRDAGRQWQAVPSFTDKALLGVSMGPHGLIAVGQEGEIWHRAKAQVSWQQADSPTRERLFAVAQGARGNAVAVGAFGTVLASSDGGASWRSAAPDWATLLGSGAAFGPSLYDVIFLSDGKVVAVGEWGLVMASDDGGESWKLLRGSSGAAAGSTIEPSLFAVTTTPDGALLAAGQEGLILRSEDGGRSWRQADKNSHVNLLSLAATDSGVVVAAGMRDTLISRDGGLTWQRFDAADFAIGWYSGAVAVGEAAGDTALLLAGHTARILRIDPGTAGAKVAGHAP